MTVSTLRLGLSFVGLLILTSVGASAWNRANAITLAAGEQPSAELTGAWRLVRTPNPRGGPEAVSIMHTADTSRSDLDLAGLMVRCNSGRSELAIVLLSAFPLRAHPRVIFGSPGHETQFEATIGPPGTAVILPGDPKVVIGSAWPAESDLFIRVIDGPTKVSGVVPLAGLQSAFTLLMSNCPLP
jgi:hypothetical protein